MADTKISALTSGTPAVTTDLIPIARGTSNFSLTAASLLAQTGSTFAVNSTTGNVTIAAPTSGAALTVNALAANGGLVITGNTTGAAIQLDNASYLTGKNSVGTSTRMVGINASNVVFLGSIDLTATGGVNFVNGGTAYMTVNSTGSITIAAPSGGTALTITGANTTTGTGLSVSGSYTGAGNGQLVTFSDLNNTNGINLRMVGNGATPSKTIRIISGNLEIMNDAYSATLLRVVDSGVIQIPAGGAMRIVATTYANIPLATTVGIGAQVWITDSGTAYSGANIGTIISVGGGANLVPLYSDGTNWRIG